MISPFFSIILPTFNRASFLPIAIRSVLEQTYIDWELIIIDDGSTDETNIIVSHFNDNRIRYFWQENQERSIARNNGISKATGEYICFLDSDDFFLPNHLQVFYNNLIIKRCPIAFFYTDLQHQNNNGQFKPLIYDFEFENDLDFVLRTTIHSQQTCIHNTILKEFRYNSKFRIGEDIELWMHIFNTYQVYHIPEITLVVVQHQERSVDYKKVDSYLSILGLYKHIFSKPNPGSKIPFRRKLYLYSALYFGIGRSYIVNTQKWKAIYYLSKSLLLSPFVIEAKHRLYLILMLLFSKDYCTIYCKTELGINE